MRFPARPIVVLLAGCWLQNVSVVATAHAQQPETTVEPTGAATAKSGIADGALSPALTEARRPLYRLCKSDVLDIGFTFSPEFNQTVIVQPDGYIPLKGAQQIYAEGMTAPDLGAVIREAYRGMLHDPEVSVTLKDFDKPFFIAGGKLAVPANTNCAPTLRLPKPWPWLEGSARGPSTPRWCCSGASRMKLSSRTCSTSNLC